MHSILFFLITDEIFRTGMPLTRPLRHDFFFAAFLPSMEISKALLADSPHREPVVTVVVATQHIAIFGVQAVRVVRGVRVERTRPVVAALSRVAHVRTAVNARSRQENGFIGVTGLFASYLITILAILSVPFPSAFSSKFI